MLEFDINFVEVSSAFKLRHVDCRVLRARDAARHIQPFDAQLTAAASDVAGYPARAISRTDRNNPGVDSL